MSKRIVLLLLLACGVMLSNKAVGVTQFIDNYDIKVEVDKDLSAMNINLTMSLINKHQQLMFMLNPEVTELQISNGMTPVQFELSSEKPNQFIDGSALKVATNLNQSLTFSYKLPIQAATYWNKGNLSPQHLATKGFEVGMYSAWLPLPPENGNFNYTVSVSAPTGFTVLGNGLVEQGKSGEWTIRSRKRQFDVPLMLSDRLKIDSVSFNGANIDVAHFGLGQEKLANLTADIKQVITLFTEKFGPSDSMEHVQFAFVPRKSGTSYSRKGFAAITDNGKEMATFSIIAHEIGHFWWAGADSSSWEDWLNESFAEQGALIAIEQKYGAQVVNARKESFAKSSKKAPAIWDIDRKKDVATLVLYRKGPLILEQLKSRMGDKSYFEFLAKLVKGNIKSTEQLLSLLRKQTSNEDALWLESALKS